MKKILFLILVSLIVTACQTNGSTNESTKVDITEREEIPVYSQTAEDIVNMHGDITNLNRFFTFLENVEQGHKDKIRVVSYTEEGDPILHDLDFDGEVIESSNDTRRDNFGQRTIYTSTCKSIELEEKQERTDYTLAGCKPDVEDTMILVIWK